MTNAEKYKDVLRSIISLNELIGVVDGKPQPCSAIHHCVWCAFYSGDCEIQAIGWLLLEESEEE